ncbi:Phosphopantetheine adenylyltransferase (Pantetheine-phosphate adenylyltransferase) (PPAT)(Dephospho-CoA pyrophosphorylase) [Metamycoplasma arthritidis]|uniref:Probable nicotinate-nucleotide adenylyltransferase n=1 Tax=Metamycoplasma arthritidis (strain 158L3-1) TaxID=243272 RepID=B3PM58_META1|nr:nicotinate-nucleotide adenylyltransferase [Metamycoplasma arthritidis]ACF07110.1 nicotinamide-nucleotide adenylyltransferase [Metamycoplasma arthritidis 158L3-1]VEU78638.1 Phosphopantetheine adenylyltransferase (Pantetheine-phosphate adenylyltransferase) (PPAT)(Dephospho-CoA pyrophosphorylase) [Metamycoplasma arthritidis]
MKIGIFGGSFNPIHKGHILVAKEAIELLNLDCLYFVPAYQNPFRKKDEYVSGEHRINMIKMVLENKMQVCDFEIKRQYKSYTIDTINYFLSKFKDAELYLIVGSDNVNKLNKWKDIDDIAKKAKIVIFNRGNKYSKINIKKYHCLELKNHLYPFSSTAYKQGNLNQVEAIVQEYIGKHWLYIADIAKNTMDIERFKHLRFTAEFAVKLAKATNYDVKEAYRAGFMHDITKRWEQQQAYDFLAKYGLNSNNLPQYMLHQTTGYYFLRDVYKYPNEEVLHAIKVHTSLELELNLLDKIIFVADKICEGRQWNGIQKLRQLCLNSFDEGFREVVKVNLEFIKQKNNSLTKDQIKIYDKWTK